MHDLSHHLVERVLPDVGLRQYVLSPPSEVVGLLAARGEVLSALSRIFVDGIFDGIRSRCGNENLHCGSVVLVQRFTKSLSVYPHFHVLVLDGGYVEYSEGNLGFIADTPPTSIELRNLEDRVMSRFSGWLGKHGYLGSEDEELEDSDAWWRAGATEPSGLLSIVPGKVRRAPRFDVNAGVRVGQGDKVGREQLCRYVSRPPLAEAQLELLDDERVRLEFRSPLRSGQSSLILHPLAVMRRLAWLLPPPGQHQIRYYGVLAPAARLRASAVPAGRVSVQGAVFGPRAFESLAPVGYRASWAKLLARVYGVDGHACSECAGPLRPVGAVLVPASVQWIAEERILPLLGTGPPGGQLCLPLAS